MFLRSMFLVFAPWHLWMRARRWSLPISFQQCLTITKRHLLKSFFAEFNLARKLFRFWDWFRQENFVRFAQKYFSQDQVFRRRKCSPNSSASWTLPWVVQPLCRRFLFPPFHSGVTRWYRVPTSSLRSSTTRKWFLSFFLIFPKKL